MTKPTTIRIDEDVLHVAVEAATSLLGVPGAFRGRGRRLALDCVAGLGSTLALVPPRLGVGAPRLRQGSRRPTIAWVRALTCMLKRTVQSGSDSEGGPSLRCQMCRVKVTSTWRPTLLATATCTFSPVLSPARLSCGRSASREGSVPYAPRPCRCEDCCSGSRVSFISGSSPLAKAVFNSTVVTPTLPQRFSTQHRKPSCPSTWRLLSKACAGSDRWMMPIWRPRDSGRRRRRNLKMSRRRSA
jgi:hypothetical protein